MAQLIKAVIDTQKNTYRSIGQVSTGDDLELELEVKMNGQPIEFINPECELLIKKSDNNRIRQTKDILYQDGKFKIKVDEQGVTYPGIVTCQLVTKENGRVSTCLFYFNVGTSLDREVLQSISKVETLEQLDEYVATAFANLDEYEKRIIAGDETIRKLNNDMSEAEKIRDAAELERQETFKTLKENMNEAITNLESSINLSNLNEKERSEVFNALKSNLESIKQDLINLNTNVESEEEKRVQAEIDRVNKTLEIIGKLESTNDKVTIAEAERVTEFNNIKSELTSLKEALTTINNIANSNEEIRKTNENGRVAAEQQRVIDFEKIKSDNTNLGTTLTKKVDDKLTEIQKDNTTFKQEINEQYEDIVTKNTEFKNQMNEDFGNAKADYFGKKHNNIVDRLNSDFDNVHQRINDANYLAYEGSNITANNSYYGYTKELSVKGRTLQNLVKGYSLSNKVIEDNGVLTFIPQPSIYITLTGYFTFLLKPNTTYSLLINMIEHNIDHDFEFVLNDINGNWVRGKKVPNTKGIQCITLTTPDRTDIKQFKLQTTKQNTTGNVKISEQILILEGDYTNTPIEAIPFIEGIKSACETDVTEEGKYPVNIKSCGKNLFYGQLQRGYWYNDTLKSSDYAVANINNIPIKTNTCYSFYIEGYNGNIYIEELNNNLQGIKSFAIKSGQFINTTNGRFLRFCTANDESKKVEIHVKVQIEEGTATDYEPYQETVHELLLDEPLRSLPNGVCDEILEDGTEIRRIGKIVLDGSEKWGANGYGGHPTRNTFEFYMEIKPVNIIGRVVESISSMFTSEKTNRIPANDNSYRIAHTENSDGAKYYFLFCPPTNLIPYRDVNAWEKWLSENPVTVYYELAESIITKHNKNINLKTYDGTTYITSDNYLQPKLSCKVPSNVQAVVSGLITENKALNTQVSTLNLENEEIKETNIIQDELINTTMMATDEMYMMLEPLLAETLSERSASKMVDMYVAMVQRGIKTIEQVPIRYREEVKKILDQLEK